MSFLDEEKDWSAGDVETGSGTASHRSRFCLLQREDSVEEIQKKLKIYVEEHPDKKTIFGCKYVRDEKDEPTGWIRSLAAYLSVLEKTKVLATVFEGTIVHDVTFGLGDSEVVDKEHLYESAVEPCSRN